MAAAIALLVACGRSAHPSATACCFDESARDAIAAVDAEATPAKDSTVVRLRREEGCARDLKTSSAIVRDLGELGRLCAQGMTPTVASVAASNMSPAGESELPFRVTSSTACLRAGAVATAGALSISLLAESGEVLAQSSSHEPLGIAPIDGSVCVREPGSYRVVVRSSGAAPSPQVAIQVWQATRD